MDVERCGTVLMGQHFSTVIAQCDDICWTLLVGYFPPEIHYQPQVEMWAYYYYNLISRTCREPFRWFTTCAVFSVEAFKR